MNDLRLSLPIGAVNASDVSSRNTSIHSRDISHSTDEKITPISVVSHSRLLRDGLVTLLAPYLLVRLVGSYGGNAHPDGQMPNPDCHIILIDSGIGRDAAALWTCWWRACPMPAQVIMLEVEDDKDAILASIEMGISGYTLKEAPPTDVAQAIYLASQGLAQCSQQMTAHLFARLAALRTSPSPSTTGSKPLTAREMDVLRCIAQGMSNKEIAAALVIEIYTVKHHVHNILEKMKLRHRYEAVRYATEQGLVVEQPPRLNGQEN